MQKPNEVCEMFWLVANDKEAEFEFFCKKYDLNSQNPLSLHFFKNECCQEVFNV